MTEQEAYELGQTTAAAWTLDRWMGARSLARGVRAAEAVLRRTAQEQEAAGGESPLWDQLWQIERATASVCSAFEGSGPLPALRLGGRSARLQVLGEALAETEAAASRETLTAYLRGVQRVQTLTEQELCLLIPALRLGCLLALSHSVQDGARIDLLSSRLAQLQTLDLLGMTEELSGVHALFSADDTYLEMEEAGRSCYRHRLAALARRQHKTEIALATELMEQAQATGQHIGFLLFPEHTESDRWYPLLLVGGTAALAALAGLWKDSLWCALLLLLPLSQVLKGGLDFLLLHLVPSRPVVRLELAEGLPREGRTLAVIAALVPDAGEADRLAHRLERAYLSNRSAGPEAGYGVLADLPDRAAPPEEGTRAGIRALQTRLEGLNARYGPHFFLLFREPVYQPGEECYRGYERKRGALMALIARLTGGASDLQLLVGEAGWLTGVRYLITLDSDTRLNLDSVRRLVGAMLHPLNRPQVDPKQRRVVRGYGLLQPRIGTALEDTKATRFAGLFGGLGGVDPYLGGASDLYQDVFQGATYTGKGILDVEAAARCLTGRFPENRVLSHDLLEGAFLRAGLAGDVEFTDGFPHTVGQYFRRQHRWVRGDWQAAAWIFPRVPQQNGERVPNPLRVIDRWKLADNLRRSLVPVGVLAALLGGICLRGQGAFLLGGVALLALAMPSLCGGVDLLLQRGRGSRQRFHSRIVAGLGRELLCVPVRLLLLPAEAWISLHGAVTALYRLHVSHQKLLEWVPSGLSGCHPSLWRQGSLWIPGLAAGLLALGGATGRGGGMLGILWLLGPLLVLWLNGADAGAPTLRGEERAFLLRQGELIWRYFREQLTEEHHFLPPDNVQEVPDGGAAPRTSPTNIGMSLLSCLAAVDLGLETPDRALDLVDCQLSALEGLEKYRGHLYNWYDIHTAQPLYPRYVSTVDSGNLCAALIALDQGLRELGEGDLACRARALADGMGFRFLYDGRRDLFHIGYDVEQDCFTPSWYDLLASEARETSYLTVARGEVPPRHWRSLGRTHARVGRYAGLMSWTGTMFEYFMPHLLLPAESGTLIYESLAFCATVQRQWGEAHDIPWGVSESGFYALNQSESYRYKAHGIQSLAFSQGLEREQVVAPYASFLTLSVLPHAAVENLKQLRAMGMEGRYGLYEALDFTPRRTGGEGLPVRSWMVHHLGMSLVAIDNALRDGAMVRRFLADPEMGAAQELLEERVQTGVPELRRKRPRRQRRNQMKQWTYQRSGQGFSPSCPACHLLAEGESRLLLTADGGSTQSWSDLLLLESVQSLLETETGRRVCFPAGEVGEALGWSFAGHDATLTLETPEGIVTQEIGLRECGSVRTFRVTNAPKGTLHLKLTPVLSEPAQYQAHRTFAQISLEWETFRNGVLYRRRPNKGKTWPVLVISWEGTGCGATVSEAGVLSLTQPISGEGMLRLAVACGDPHDARCAAEALLLGMHQRELDSFSRAAVRLGLAQEAMAADELLSALLFPRRRVEAPVEQAALWPFGISGDDPLWVVEGGTQEALELPLRLWQMLRELGARFDLTLLVPQAQQETLDRWLRQQTEPGGKGGVHLVASTESARAALFGRAQHIGPVGNVGACGPKEGLPPLLPPVEPGIRTVQWGEETVQFRLSGRLDHRRWTHVLANERFGYLADECGTGHLWDRNARENKLTPWQNEPLAQSGPENVEIQAGGQTVSLFAREDGGETTVTYGPGWASWERRLGTWRTKLTALVPADRPCRWLFVEAEGIPSDAVLIWTLRPQMADRQSEQYYVTAQEVEGGLVLQNPANTRFPGQKFHLIAQGAQAQYDPRKGAVLTLPMGRSQVLYAGMEPQSQPPMLGVAKQQVTDWWLERTAPLTVETPDGALNHYLNFWCRYQVIACRLYARCGLYQCGGAYGFRDQLQDACNLLPFAPELAREQILRCCSRQYEAGDVQHWWHPMGPEIRASGVRTRISDDLIWLPWAVNRYLEVTGDHSLLEEERGFLQSPRLKREEQDRFEQPVETEQKTSVFDHCVRALECALGRGVGAHGLCLMGSGDWNDGMDRIGQGGKGESVWLTWFLSMVLRDFAQRCPEQQKRRYQTLSASLARAANEAWDGAWYRRAYTDDGVPVGSATSPECQIDSIAQSFGVFAPNPDRDQGVHGVRSALERLHSREHRTVALLDTPFGGALDAGYISAYPPGVRENGGQYTHGAVWLAMAALRSGLVEEGWSVLRDLLPEHHDPAVYQGEPYVLAGDVSTAPGREGRAGWTWYTGSAGWYGRVATEELLGLRVTNGVLHLKPRLPAAWTGYQARLRWGKGTFHIHVTRGTDAGVWLNGAPAPYGISLSEWEGVQQVQVTVAQESTGKQGP